MKKLGILCPKPQDGTSWYRGFHPLSRLEKQMPDWKFHYFDVEQIDDWFWSTGIGCDVLFLQRPSNESLIEFVTDAKIIGTKIWLDFDDDLLTVPSSNPSHKFYSSPQKKKAIKKLCEMAHVVTVSTQGLADSMPETAKRVEIVPNCSDLRIQGHTEKLKTVQKIDKLIFWRGSATHDEDLFEYCEAMAEIAKLHKDWKFFFLGAPWWGVNRFIPENQLLTFPPVHLPRYFSFIEAMSPEICIVPLARNVFNTRKSNIAWQEASLAGSACVVPNWTEWQHEGAMLYENPKEFVQCVSALIKDPSFRARCVQMSREKIRQIFDLETVGVARRREILESLV